MRRLLVTMLVLLTATGFAQDDDHGHDHGHDHGEVAPHAAAGAGIATELRLAIQDPNGQPVTGIAEAVEFELFHDDHEEAHLHAHADDEPGSYHVEHRFSEEGTFRGTWRFSLDGVERSAGFDIVVAHAEEEAKETGPNLLLIGSGAIGLAVIAFLIGRSAGKAKPAVAGAIILGSLILVAAPSSARQEDDHGHDHGAAVGTGSAEELQIGIKKPGVMVETMVVDGYALTFSIEVVPPDPNVIVLTDEQRELLDVKVETVNLAAFGGGLKATGEIVVDPSKTASLSVPFAGKVSLIDVREGALVRQGQVLAIVDSPEAASAQADLAAAQAVMLQAQANRQRAVKSLELARQNLKRQQEFAATGAFAQPSLLAARTAAQQAHRDVKEAESRLAQAKIKADIHERELRRMEELFRGGVASRRQLEEAQLEARLDAEALVQAESGLAEAKAAASAADVTLRREEDIARRGLLNRREVETARGEVNRAEGELKAVDTEIRGAQATVQAARIRMGAFGSSGGKIRVVSPISGTVSKRHVSRGQAVSPGQTLVEVLDTREIWVRADVFESDLLDIKVGTPVEVTAQSSNGITVRGLVASIGQVVDADRRTAPVRIKIANPDGALRQNEFANILLITNIQGRNLSVPQASVQDLGGQSVVFVEDEDGFRRVSVKTGIKTGNRVEILEGLKSGDRVATQGSYQLRMMAAAQ